MLGSRPQQDADPFYAVVLLRKSSDRRYDRRDALKRDELAQLHFTARIGNGCSFSTIRRPKSRVSRSIGTYRMSAPVKSVVFAVVRSLPVFPRKRTFSGAAGMSHRCQQETHRSKR